MNQQSTINNYEYSMFKTSGAHKGSVKESETPQNDLDHHVQST